MTTHAQLRAAACAGEAIDIVRVRLARTGASAVVGELHAADRVLADWAAGTDPERALSFEVTFGDGYTFRGRYDYGRMRRGRPSLSRFVRRAFACLAQTPPTWPEGIASASLPAAELWRYALGIGGLVAVASA